MRRKCLGIARFRRYELPPFRLDLVSTLEYLSLAVAGARQKVFGNPLLTISWSTA